MPGGIEERGDTSMIVSHDQMAPGAGKNSPGVDEIRVHEAGHTTLVGNQVDLPVADRAGRYGREGKSRHHAGEGQGGSAVELQ